MQTEQFLVPAIDVVHTHARFAKLGVERLSEAWANVKQTQEAGRVQAAAMSEAGANDVVVVRRDRLQPVQHRDGIIQHLVGAANQAARVAEISLFNKRTG